MDLKSFNNHKSGFSLIEVLVVMFIVAVAFTSFYTVSTVGTRYIIESKNRLGAVAFANEKMEIARNLAYENVGVQGNLDVPGNISAHENVSANGRSYDVDTEVRYVDDPMDGTVLTSPADAIPNDYKVVEVVVSWKDSLGQTQRVSSSSRFVPPGLETSVNSSPLAINVTDGETLLPISNAAVHIVNDTVSPVIDDIFYTDLDGHILLPAALISSDNHVTITKASYEDVVTMDSSATFTPRDRHVSVVANFLNSYNYFQNKPSSLAVRTADYQNNPIGSVDFSIGGGRILGNDDLGNDVFSLAPTAGTTGAVSGEKEYLSISPGNYLIETAGNAQYEFIDYDPSLSPAYLAPGTVGNYTLRLADKNVSALFLEIKDAEAPNAPIAGAKVTLTDGGVDVFTEKLSSLRGVIFYPDGGQVLENKTYDLKIEADGYVSGPTQPVTIDNLTHVLVNLVKI